MMRLTLLLALVGCGDNIIPDPPDAATLPTCESLGCPSPEIVDKLCAIRGECYCQLSRDQPRIRCSK